MPVIVLWILFFPTALTLLLNILARKVLKSKIPFDDPKHIYNRFYVVSITLIWGALVLLSIFYFRDML